MPAGPQALTLSTRLNGDLRQQSGTGDMIWSCAELIGFFSVNFTLKPGMVILTGAPSAPYDQWTRIWAGASHRTRANALRVERGILVEDMASFLRVSAHEVLAKIRS